MVKKDTSYGVIPFMYINGMWKVLLIQHVKGHWAFPKGHPDNQEEPMETAIRELKEETALNVVSWISIEPFFEHYVFTAQGESIEKTVAYFLAIVKGEVYLEKREISDAKWLSYKEAEMRATFPETKKICKKLIELTF